MKHPGLSVNEQLLFCQDLRMYYQLGQMVSAGEQAMMEDFSRTTLQANYRRLSGHHSGMFLAHSIILHVVHFLEESLCHSH